MSTPDDLRDDADRELMLDRHDALHREPNYPQPRGECSACDDEYCEEHDAWHGEEHDE